MWIPTRVFTDTTVAVPIQNVLLHHNDSSYKIATDVDINVDVHVDESVAISISIEMCANLT